MSPRVVKALELARQPVDAATLRDDTPIRAWLDLRSRSPHGFTEPPSALRRVARSVAQRLAAGHDLRLVVSSGLADSSWAATAIAESLNEFGQAGTAVAVIRGEDIGHSLEEWHNAGEALRENETGERLFDCGAEVVDAYAPAPTSALQAATGMGARIVVSAYGDACAACNDQPEDQTAPDRHALLVWLLDHYRLAVCIPFDQRRSAEQQAKSVELLADETPIRCQTSIVDSHDSDCLLVLDARSEDRDSLVTFAGVLSELGQRSDGRLFASIAPWRQVHSVVRPWHTDVAADLLEFGHDLRPARDWLDDLPPSTDA